MQLINSIFKILGFGLRDTLNAKGAGSTSLNAVLPNEILAHIATFLKPADLANLQLLSQDFHALSHDAFDIAWQPYLEKLKEIDPTVSFISWQKKTRQVQLKEHFMRIAREQFEEIQFLQNSSNDPTQGAKLSEITEPAKTLIEIYQREQLLNQLNVNLIKQKIDKNRNFLNLDNMSLTRFPKELFEDAEYTSYWSKLTRLNFRNNFIKYLPDTLASCKVLESLDCSSNQLTALPDLSNCSALVKLNCNSNKLVALPNLSKCTVLEVLYCLHNKLTALPDLSNCSALKYIACIGNKLTALPDLSNCSALEVLNCYSNELTALPDLSNCSALNSLVCSGNQLTALPDLSNCSALKLLDCSDNELTALPDLSNCSALDELYCIGNKLTALPDLSKCTVLKMLACSSNELVALPNLGNCNALGEVLCSNNKLTALPDFSPSLCNLDCYKNELTALPQSLADCHNLTILFLGNNYLKTIPDEIRVGFDKDKKEAWYKDTMASQKNLFLTNMKKRIKANQNYLKAMAKNCIAQFIETLKAPSDHPLKVGLLSSVLCAVASMSFFSSSVLFTPSILLGGLVTMGIKTKNHFANKALHRAEQQPNSDSAAAPVSAGEKRDSNWYQYAQGLYTSVLFAAGNQRVENNVGAQPENTSTVNAALKP